jgi:hypothetical protein
MGLPYPCDFVFTPADEPDTDAIKGKLEEISKLRMNIVSD